MKTTGREKTETKIEVNTVYESKNIQVQQPWHHYLVHDITYCGGGGLYLSDQFLKGYHEWLQFHNKICETYLDKWWLGPFLSLFIHKCITPQLLINGKWFVSSEYCNELFYHESTAVTVFLPDFHGSFQKLNPCPLINWIMIKWLLIYDTMTRAIFHADTFHKSQRERLRRKDLVLII